LIGDMLVGVRNDSLLIRLDPEQSDEAFTETHVSVFKITGRGTMKGWVVVGLEGVEDDAPWSAWIRRPLKSVEKMPAK
jgi:hypothetical protein